MNPFYIAAAAVFALILSFGAGYHFGGLGGQVSDAKAIIRQDAKIQKQESTDATRVNAEAAAFERAPLEPIPAPVVRVQYREAPACVPRPPATGSGPHVPADLPASAVVDSVPGPDIGRPVVSVGHEADAQIAGLQDYIQHVCRVPAP